MGEVCLLLIGFSVECICCRLVISPKVLQQDKIHGSKTSKIYKINLQEKNCDVKDRWIKDCQIQIIKITLLLTPNKSDILFPQNINYVYTNVHTYIHTYIHTYMHTSFRRSTNSVIQPSDMKPVRKKNHITHKQNNQTQYNTINKCRYYSLQNRILYIM